MPKNPAYEIYNYTNRHADGSTSTRIVAVSKFAGQTVKGYADCREGDVFDLEYGMNLAAARCAEKIAAKRCKRAYSKVDEAKAEMDAAILKLRKAMQYERDAEQRYNDAALELAEIVAEKAGKNE